MLEYRLTSSTRYFPDGVHLTEQVRVKDDAGRELRKVELERVFGLRETTLLPSEESLWNRVVGARK